jgi:hypothetical protein
MKTNWLKNKRLKNCSNLVVTTKNKKQPKMKKIYISGKITEATKSEIDEFEKAEAALLINWDVKNPLKNGLGADATWEEHMARDLSILKTCDAIFMLNTYEKSIGAKIELLFAKEKGLFILYQGKRRIEHQEIQILQLNIEKIMGIEDLRSPNRQMEYTAARAIMAYKCHQAGMRREDIAPIVGRKEGSVQNMIKTYKEWMTTWPDFQKWVKQLNQIIN